jgi:hypothetical protein
MLFKEISGKKVEVDFNGGEVSSGAGLLFLRETESQIGIIIQVANAIHDKRHPSYVKHQIVQLLTQRVFQIASGYEDANDSNDLKNDPILKISCDQDDALASQLSTKIKINLPSSYPLKKDFGKIWMSCYSPGYS